MLYIILGNDYLIHGGKRPTRGGNIVLFVLVILTNLLMFNPTGALRIAVSNTT